MYIYKSLVALVFGAAYLSAAGCATMSASECMTVDWRTIGYEDGVAGFSR